MSKRHILVMLSAGALTIVLGAGALAMLFGHKYVDYVPLVAVDAQTEWRFEVRPEMLSDTHVAAMIKQLEKYGKRYRVQDGRLQIAEDLAEDRDLLANLTQKAPCGAGIGFWRLKPRANAEAGRMSWPPRSPRRMTGMATRLHCAHG